MIFFRNGMFEKKFLYDWEILFFIIYRLSGVYRDLENVVKNVGLECKLCD